MSRIIMIIHPLIIFGVEFHPVQGVVHGPSVTHLFTYTALRAAVILITGVCSDRGGQAVEGLKDICGLEVHAECAVKAFRSGLHT